MEADPMKIDRINFLAFVLIVGLIVGLLYFLPPKTPIGGAIQVGNEPPVQPPSSEKPIQIQGIDLADNSPKGLTFNLLKLNDALNRATADQKPKISAKLQELTANRKIQLMELIEKNPSEALKLAFPKNVKQKFPQTTQSNIEEEVFLEGPIVHFHFDDFEKGNSKHAYYLNSMGNRLELFFEDGKKAETLPDGTIIKAHGIKVDGKVAVFKEQPFKTESISETEPQQNFYGQSVPLAPEGESGPAYYVDTTPPTVSITSPANGLAVSGTVTFIVDAQDYYGQVVSVELIDGVAINKIDTTGQTGPFTITWDTRNYTNGTHYILAKATDDSGNWATGSAPSTGLLVINVNNSTASPATIALSPPPKIADFISGVVQINVSASDTQNGIGSVELWIDGQLFGADNLAPYSFSWDTRLFTNVRHEYAALMKSPQGTITKASTPIYVFLNNSTDASPPTISITSPATGSTVSGIINITADAFDDIGIQKVSFYRDAWLIGVDTPAPYSISWDSRYDATLVKNGSHTLTAKADDFVQHTTTSAPVTVTTSNTGDTTKPTVSITSPANGSTVSGTITVSAIASDNTQVGDVRLSVDNWAGSYWDPIDPYSFTIDSRNFANGTHTLFARATDIYGNIQDSAPISITANNTEDITKPTIKIISPANMATVSGIVNFDITITDPGYSNGIYSVNVYREEVLIATDKTSPYSLSWDTTAETNGKYSLGLRVFDNAGNVGGTTIYLNVNNAGTVPQPVKKVAVILFNFNNNNKQETTPEHVRELVFTGTSSVNNFYKTTSFGTMGLTGKLRPDGDVFGWFTIKDQAGDCAWNSWTDQVQQLMQQQGIDLTGYSNYVYLFPSGNNSCFAGWANAIGQGPGALWLNGFVSDGAFKHGVAHELGHNFGLDHARSWGCMDSLGQPVPLSSNCTYSEYGDALEVMGSSNGHFNTIHKELLGQLDNWNPALKTQDITSPGTYDIYPVEKASTGPQTLKINRNSAQPQPNLSSVSPNFFGIEYRVVDTFDTTQALVGVFIRIGYILQPAASYLISLRGALGGTFDQLPVGKTFTDPFTGVSITNLAQDITKATILIGLDSSTCTRSNPSISVSPATQWGSPGQTLTYSVTVSNLDSTACSSEAFNLTSTAPTGFVQSPQSTTVNLSFGASTTANISITAPTNATAGQYNFTETITNSIAPAYAASSSAAYNVAVTGDTAPPTTSITFPSNGATISGTITISATASDNVGVTKVEFYNGSALIGSDTTAPYSLPWNTINAANGSYTLTTKAYDGANNIGSSAPVTITVSNVSDTTTPTTAITSPTTGVTVSGTISLSANANDNVGVAKVEFYRDSTFIGTDAIAPYNMQLDTTSTTNGPHALTSKAFDAAGNTGTSAPVMATVNNVADTNGPALTVTPANNSTLPTKGSFTITAAATDQSGVNKIEIYFDNTLIKTCTGVTTCSKNLPVSQLASGTHQIKATATDNSTAKNTTTITNTVTKP